MKVGQNELQVNIIYWKRYEKHFNNRKIIYFKKNKNPLSSSAEGVLEERRADGVDGSICRSVGPLQCPHNVG